MVNREIVREDGSADVTLSFDWILRQTLGISRQRTRSGNLPEGLRRFRIDLGDCWRDPSNGILADVAVCRSAPQSGKERNHTETLGVNGSRPVPCGVRICLRVL